MLILITFILVIISLEVLQYVLYIQYSIHFYDNKVKAFIDSGSEVNAMTPFYIIKLCFTT